ncbi:MBL fold metallo-hydrolase [Halalkalicoccus sp. NIPERK01]|uniref:MBL fold metallo-hydrolase n=1 Tax=Halalkalicoccus sp. NIPERK01 TaxID=3053469 RepID=UPI00256ED4A9|nr:MBL fold metallo-hydrolase [Halalkalicoccus sp. NIPERK01]MDL5361294.1 MBL fold metallo-hydrolase [Halalkalicoccus sp. NIPERK01]
MRVTFLGTGSAMPTGERFQTGLLLEGDEGTLLVDCGSGALHGLARTGVGYEGVSSVLLTHHHLDHVADLMPLMKARWLAGEEHLEIAGPQGTKALVDGLLDVHEYMQDRLDLTVREVGPYGFGIAGFDVEGYETRHSMYCLAYRFGEAAASGAEGSGDDSRGVFTFSGDSDAFEGLANFAEGSAVLVHDCSFPDDVDVSGHPTPSQLGEALSGHEIGRVYLTHLYPHTDGRHDEMLESIAEAYDGDVRVAEDGLSVTIS